MKTNETRDAKRNGALQHTPAGHQLFDDATHGSTGGQRACVTFRHVIM
jgi:hypothetical protein